MEEKETVKTARTPVNGYALMLRLGNYFRGLAEFFGTDQERNKGALDLADQIEAFGVAIDLSVPPPPAVRYAQESAAEEAEEMEENNRPNVVQDDGSVHIGDWLQFHAYEAFKNPVLAWAHLFFAVNLQPSFWKRQHLAILQVDQKQLFVDYEGETWQVTGCSRMGDIYLSGNFGFGEIGYDRRVFLHLTKMTNWRHTL